MKPRILPVDAAAIRTAVTQTKNAPKTRAPRTVGDTAEFQFVLIGDLIPDPVVLI